MRNAVTISLPGVLNKSLDAFAKARGVSRSQAVQEFVKRGLAVSEFKALRELALPFARKKGIFTDEDVFKLVS